jgi:hypothetical protein
MRTRMAVSLKNKPAMTVHRRILEKDKLVYLLVAPKPIKRENGRSRIAYIGTTKKGADRIATSAAYRAEEILEMRGLRTIDVYMVSCKARPGLKVWEQLEDALLAEFRSCYFELPLCNDRGKKLRWTRKLGKLFKRERINKILMTFDATER